jgi:hypothetical protein
MRRHDATAARHALSVRFFFLVVTMFWVRYCSANSPAVMPHQRMVDDDSMVVLRIWEKQCRTSPTLMSLIRDGVLREVCGGCHRGSSVRTHVSRNGKKA